MYTLFIKLALGLFALAVAGRQRTHHFRKRSKGSPSFCQLAHPGVGHPSLRPQICNVWPYKPNRLSCWIRFAHRRFMQPHKHTHLVRQNPSAAAQPMRPLRVHALFHPCLATASLLLHRCLQHAGVANILYCPTSRSFQTKCCRVGCGVFAQQNLAREHQSILAAPRNHVALPPHQ